MEKKEIIYPAEITFKSVFKNKSYTEETIKSILGDININCSINGKESKNSKFISYTITAEFPSEEILDSICKKISTLEGFMMMF